MRVRRRHLTTLTGFGLAVVLTTSLAGATSAAPSEHRHQASLELPTGFQPEGIDIAGGNRAFLGSLADGDLLQLNLRTGAQRVVAEGEGIPAVGLKIDNRGRAFIAGGPSGTARVVDTRTGETLATYQFNTGSSFVNDVVLLKGDAYFTDSANAQLYRLDVRGPQLPASFETIPLTGEWEQGPGFNANGIAYTTRRDALLVVNSQAGLLYRVDPRTGAAQVVDLGGTVLTNGDGLLTRGRTLYVVQNRLNRVAVIRLSPDATSGTLQRTLTSPEFDVPTTVARAGNRLYLPNARFGIADPANADYSVIRVRDVRGR